MFSGATGGDALAAEHMAFEHGGVSMTREDFARELACLSRGPECVAGRNAIPLAAHSWRWALGLPEPHRDLEARPLGARMCPVELDKTRTIGVNRP